MRVDQMLGQDPVGENDSVVFLIVGHCRRKSRSANGEPLPDHDEHVLCPPFPPDMPTSWWIVCVWSGVTLAAAFENEEGASEAFHEEVRVPRNAEQYERIALKAYKEIKQGDSTGFSIRWEFLTDIAVHYFEPIEARS